MTQRARFETCSTCEGAGRYLDSTAGDGAKCLTCGGLGVVLTVYG